MKAIVAVDQNWGIGYQGNLLQRIPGDMKYFREKTIGKIVVMGRETFESFPGQEPLKDRINIVLTRNKNYQNDKVTICHSLEDLFWELQKYDPENIFVIGGESVYTQLLPYCTEAFVTKIENIYPADKYFNNLDKEQSWKLIDISEEQIFGDISYRFLTYKAV